jgi:hypothetical protein
VFWGLTWDFAGEFWGFILYVVEKVGLVDDGGGVTKNRYNSKNKYRDSSLRSE